MDQASFNHPDCVFVHMAGHVVKIEIHRPARNVEVFEWELESGDTFRHILDAEVTNGCSRKFDIRIYQGPCIKKLDNEVQCFTHKIVFCIGPRNTPPLIPVQGLSPQVYHTTGVREPTPNIFRLRQTKNCIEYDLNVGWKQDWGERTGSHVGRVTFPGLFWLLEVP